MFKKQALLKQTTGLNFENYGEQLTGSDLTMQEKLEIILDRPNYSQLRAAEDAADFDSD